MQSTLLITGGAGYIGSHTAFYLHQKSYNIIIIDDFSHKQNFNPTWAKVIKADFSDKEIISQIFENNNIEAVMHFAAFIDVNESVKNPIKFYNNNVAKTIELLNLMLEYQVNKFIFSSSCAVYGIPEYLPLNEEHSKKPINPYGQCKLMIENILKDISNSYNFNYVSLRYFNASGALPEYGLGEQHNPETHMIPLLLKSLSLHKPFTIYGTDYPTKDGTCVRDFIHVLDIADAHWLALQHLNNGNPSDCFNLGTGQGFTVKEIIQTIENLYRAPIQIINEKKREGDPAILIADPTKANNILKWQAKNSNLELILRSAYIFGNNIVISDKTSRIAT